MDQRVGLWGVLVGCAIAVPAGATRLPTVRPLEDILADQVQLVIDAGHLRPLKCDFEQHCGGLGNYGFEMDEYWANPAELVYTLAIAIPHLEAPLQSAAMAHLQEEFENPNADLFFPPYQFVKMNGRGASRRYQDTPAELFPAPTDPAQRAADYEAEYGIRYAMQSADASWLPWSFNPFNIYACWKYAELFPGEAQRIFDLVKDKIGDLPEDAILQTYPHTLNQYVAGYVGYLGLQSLLGEAPSAVMQARLDEAMAKRVSLLPTIDPTEGIPLFGIEAGGFLYLTPELGDYLFQNARAEVEAVLSEQEWGAPYWHIARAEEVSRYDPTRAFMEGYHQHLFETASQFQARALALKWERQKLERYLDVPAVWRGDLYYLQNIVATLEAPGEPPPPPPPWGDADGPPLVADDDPGVGDGDLDGSSRARGGMVSGCACDDNGELSGGLGALFLVVFGRARRRRR